MIFNVAAINVSDIDEFGGVSDMMSKLDEFLSKNNVDSTACVQKAVCHYIRNSSASANQGAANQIEEMALALTEWVYFFV